MQASEFVRKWSESGLRERQGSQEHFIDLCRLLEEPTPAEDDPRGDRYCFERGATKAGGGDGWADVWRRGCFAWEYKGKHKDLDAAFRQLAIYASDLETPPYLVTSDMARIVIRTNFTNTVTRKIELTLDDLIEPKNLVLLKAVFQGSDSLKPKLTPQDLTAKVALRFGELGLRLQERRGEDGKPLHDPRAVAHFLNQLIFCMFAEDAELLPKELFTRTIRATVNKPAAARRQLADLFHSMSSGLEEDRFFGAEMVRWFNGGLFDGAPPLPLESVDLKLIAETAEEHNWSEIDPAVFGTLFEQAMEAKRERKALGAHYTDRDKILRIVEPVVVEPLKAEWAAVREAIAADMAEAKTTAEARRGLRDAAAELMAASPSASRSIEDKRRKDDYALGLKEGAARRSAAERLSAWQERLANFRVLDPACGSGNFLYVALHALHEIELRSIADAERLGVPAPAPRVGPQCVRGIEIDRYAAELARVTLWIGDLQWLKKNNLGGAAEPVLSALDGIENRDALLNADGTEAEWPDADVIVGNPPFVGGKKLRDALGDAYVERLFGAYRGRVPAEADLVAYWVEKAWRKISLPSPSRGEGPGMGVDAATTAGAEAGAGETGDASVSPPPSQPFPPPGGRALRAGLVTTNSIRGGASRRVVDPIADAGALMEAWPDEPWTLEGAAVRVSMLGFGEGFVARRRNGAPAVRINADLTSGLDFTARKILAENASTAFVGVILNGEFEVPGDVARQWLLAPSNVNGRTNQDVLRPSLNGDDFNGTRPDKWVVDFGVKRPESEAAFYELPFRYVLERVKPYRQRLKEDGTFAVRADSE